MTPNHTAIPGLSHHERPASRREFLSRRRRVRALAMACLLAADPLRAMEPPSPLSAKLPHYRATAKNVIFVFIEGGPSHLDLFDPKPLLRKLAGKPLPDSVPRPITAMGESGSPLLADKRAWKQHGQSGIWVSDWLPHTAGQVDDIAVIRSCVADGINHSGGVCQMNTGSVLAGRPSLGAGRPMAWAPRTRICRRLWC